MSASAVANMRPDTDADHRTLVREMAIAAGVFLTMCVVVLVRAPQLMEPDDFAYRASIIALSQGHLLLTNAQYIALKTQLSAHGGPGIEQWVRLRSGKWISEKNPGYPFFAVIFQWLHALRAAPLFYGALGSAGLFYGGRKWLGPRGGVYAVALYCFSGATLIFAWRSTISTFTDASLIAAAAGLLLGVFLARDDPPSRRFVLGALAFLALDGATFIRYTDVVDLFVALIAVILFSRVCGVSWASVLGWFSIVAVFGAFDLVMNHLLYGGIFTTGYPFGVVTFGTSAIIPNLERMPARLVESLPMVLIALASLVWIALRLWRDHRSEARLRFVARRDAVVAGALAAGWLAVWGLYSTYIWTVRQTLGPGNPIHVVRFYVPALGFSALLAAWLLSQLPRRAALASLALIAGLSLWSFVTPSNDIIVGRHADVPGPGESGALTSSGPQGARTHRSGAPVLTMNAPGDPESKFGQGRRTPE